MDGQQSAWSGRLPSVRELERFVMAYVVSTMPGYCNEHIGFAEGIRIPHSAVVRLNRKPFTVMVAWHAPAFLVLPNPA